VISTCSASLWLPYLVLTVSGVSATDGEFGHAVNRRQQFVTKFTNVQCRHEPNLLLDIGMITYLCSLIVTGSNSVSRKRRLCPTMIPASLGFRKLAREEFAASLPRIERLTLLLLLSSAFLHICKTPTTFSSMAEWPKLRPFPAVSTV
jgi:hypothetical protein